MAKQRVKSWTVQEATQALTAGTSRYTLSSDVLDLVEAFIRTDAADVNSQFDQTLSRISISQYAHLSNKLTQSKPLQYYIEKDPSAISVNLWPSPDDQKTYTLVYYYMQRVEDAGSPASNNMDIPSRFLPCLVAGLAYKLSIKYGPDTNRSTFLKADYEEQWTEAADADRGKASVHITRRLCNDMTSFAAGKYAFGYCDRTGFRYAKKTWFLR